MNFRFLFLATLFSSVSINLFSNDNRAQDFAATCEQRLIEGRTIKGDAEDWFFPMREIKQLSLGQFWEKPWEEISRNQSDPTPSMVEFHNLLAEKNVNLLVVPIPAKATIYPEKFSKDFEPGEAQGVSPYIQKLVSLGLNVVDLEPLFLEMRGSAPDEKFWCSQDAHFSPKACVKVADVIAEHLENDFGVTSEENSALARTAARNINIKGDLVAYTEWEKSVTPELLEAQFVSPKTPLVSNLESPILLLGDSHTLVFSDSQNFHCEAAGLFDHLSSAMGQAVDLEGTASGGLVTSRINLFRKAASNPGYWDKKKVVVWVFTAREFTQCSYNRGFISVPIER